MPNADGSTPETVDWSLLRLGSRGVGSAFGVLSRFIRRREMRGWRLLMGSGTWGLLIEFGPGTVSFGPIGGPL